MRNVKLPISILMSGIMFLAHTASASYYKSYYDRSIPSVVITVKNDAPSKGTSLTPFWLGMHDGSFDTFDENTALGDTAANPNLVPAPAVERVAEDGNTELISKEFSLLQPRSPQATLVSKSALLNPGEMASITLNVNPLEDRFFSYASMIIPSNDAFIANENPMAHQLFDEYGYFIAEDFNVIGKDIVDAGTEANDEITTNIAYLEQILDNTGTPENNVVGKHPGLLRKSSHPQGILNDPEFARADFVDPHYRVTSFSFRYVDLGGRVRFTSQLMPDPTISTTSINYSTHSNSSPVAKSYATAKANLRSKNAESIRIKIQTNNLSSDLVSAHLHRGLSGEEGPIVVDIEDNIYDSKVDITIQASDILGDLSEGKDPMLNLLNEMAAGRIYVSLRTEDFPTGELRGQLTLR
ncbi:spondin domain-containing protein [Agarilytica rhodophyticola]|uniref:spondin domain-containing protein n=1 Tax=Agarilytica rhodophyticola TaxID=1737490 RepID=UPI000B341B50|nr:spondin domain-containing protein [Agarilytica rhodophyticola]